MKEKRIIDAEKLLSDINLTQILSDKGKDLLTLLLELYKKYDLVDECEEVSVALFNAVDSYSWPAVALTTMFLFDKMLQDNPVTQDAEDENQKEYIHKLIDNLEEKMNGNNKGK